MAGRTGTTGFGGGGTPEAGGDATYGSDVDVYGTHYSDSDLGEEELLELRHRHVASLGEMSGKRERSNAHRAWSIDVDSSGTVNSLGPAPMRSTRTVITTNLTRKSSGGGRL